MSVPGLRGGVSFAAIACVLLSTGCSFNKEWKAAQNCCYPGDPLAGAWEGEWHSHCNKHHGSLKAVFTPCGPNTYRARYHATFLGFIPYGYTTTHTTCDQSGAAYFTGKADLGCLAGGEYCYWGLSNGSMFESGYKSAKDEGVYMMHRAGCCQTGRCQTAGGGAIPSGIPVEAAPAGTPVEAAPTPAVAPQSVTPPASTDLQPTPVPKASKEADPKSEPTPVTSQVSYVPSFPPRD